MLLEVRDLSFSYRGSGRQIFRDVNLSLAAGEVLTILGPNGAGKSTLLNCLANLLTPNSGKIFLDGCPLSRMRLRDVARIIGFVPQNHNAMYAYTVRDFVVMGRAPHLGMFRRPSAADYALADSVMGELNILHYADRPYTRISGGERQQALIARALVQEPKILMFDEPTNHLDFGNQLRTVNKIGELTKKGYAVVMTTHMPDHAMCFGGLTAILNRRGEFLCGSADEVITEENLRDIYQTDIRIVYVPEAGYRICVFARNSS